MPITWKYTNSNVNKYENKLYGQIIWNNTQKKYDKFNDEITNIFSDISVDKYYVHFFFLRKWKYLKFLIRNKCFVDGQT